MSKNSRDKLKKFSANNGLEYYTSKANIANQELVNDTITYFDTGPGRMEFKPLQFLNLLWQQYNIVFQNIQDPSQVMQNLEALPLSKLQQHILYGLLIKWFGGYPLEASMGIGDADLHYQFRKVLLKGFLQYEGATPEKEFCKADFNQRKDLQKLEVSLNAHFNYGLDVKQVYESLPATDLKEQKPLSFEKLYEEAARYNAFGEFKTKHEYLLKQSACLFEFNVWLQESKGWERGDNEQYQTFLTKTTLIEFLCLQKQLEDQKHKRWQIEKDSWQVRPEKSKSDIVEIVRDRYALQDFLSVPSPDVVHENAFWHDQKDQPVDCNIYHPKYGYNGFETWSKEPIVASFHPITVYQDERTHKYVYCQHNLQMLCIDGFELYNKDKEKIKKVTWTMTSQLRLAENNQDFNVICLREGKNKNIDNLLETKKQFIHELINHTYNLIILHKDSTSYNEGRDINILALATRFIAFLQECITIQPAATKLQISTYKWLGKANELKPFYNELKGIHISSKTSFATFKKVFSDANTDNLVKVEWKNTNASELLDFVHELMKAGLILDERKRMNYQRLMLCFSKPGGIDFTENFKELFQEIKNGMSRPRPGMGNIIRMFL